MSEIVYIDVHKLYQHPNNPRKNVDDLEELAGYCGCAANRATKLKNPTSVIEHIPK